jgi:FkbM family methyltransferase
MTQQAQWGAFTPGATASAVLWLSRYTLLGRGFSRKAMAALFRALHSGPVDVPLWGTDVRLHPDNNVVERKALLRPDYFDAAERDVLRQVMNGTKPVFVDVGGNAGLYSLDASLHASDDATILMIEPDAVLVSRFIFNVTEGRRLGHIKPSLSVKTIVVAISDRDGSGVLSSAGDEGSRSLVVGTSLAGLRVPLRTLHAVITDAQIDHIDIMKIDVEGHEDKVLSPFLQSAPQKLWPKMIIIEHLQRQMWAPDCIADATARGYRIAKTTRNNTFLERG